MAGHTQLNIHHCLLVLFQGSFPENSALACETILQPFTLNIAFVFVHDKSHLAHPGSFNDKIMFAQYHNVCSISALYIPSANLPFSLCIT